MRTTEIIGFLLFFGALIALALAVPGCVDVGDKQEAKDESHVEKETTVGVNWFGNALKNLGIDFSRKDSPDVHTTTTTITNPEPPYRWIAALGGVTGLLFCALCWQVWRAHCYKWGCRTYQRGIGRSCYVDRVTLTIADEMRMSGDRAEAEQPTKSRRLRVVDRLRGKK